MPPLKVMRIFTIIMLILAFGFCAETVDDAHFSINARTLAMGGASAGQRQGMGSAYINPANIITTANMEFGYSTGKVFDDYLNYSVGFVKNLDSIIFLGFNFSGAEIDGISRVEKIGDRPEVLYETSNKRSVMMLTLALLPTDFISIGVNFKTYNQNLFNESATGMSIDLGANTQLMSGLNLGLTMRNFGGSKLVWSTGAEDELQKENQIGLSYEVKMFIFQTIINADKVIDDNGSELESLTGIEIWLLKNILAVRAGSRDYQRSLGVGLQIDYMILDYVYLDHEDLGLTHQMGVSCKF